MEPPSYNLWVNSFILTCILLVISFDMQIDSSFNQRVVADSCSKHFYNTLFKSYK
jgi:hypothetical protein